MIDLAAFALGVGQNATWDFVKLVVGKFRESGRIDFERLLVKAFCYAVDEHNQRYDKVSQQALLDFRKQVADNPSILLDVLGQIRYENFGQFLAAIGREEYQRRVAEQLHARYLRQAPPEATDTTVQMLADTLAFYRETVMEQITSENVLRLIWEQSLHITQGVQEVREDIADLSAKTTFVFDLITSNKYRLEEEVKPLEKPYCNLPGRVKGFVGREKEIEDIKSALQGGASVIVWGAPGIGKTAVATQVANDIFDAGIVPDGALQLSIERERPSLEIVLRRLASDLCQAQIAEQLTDLEQAKSSVRQLLRGCKVLAVVDGLENAKDLEQLLEFLGTLPDSVLLMATSRERITGSFSKYFDLGPLPRETAALLLLNLARLSHTYAVSMPEVSAICQELGDHPLGITVAGGYMIECRVPLMDYLWLLKASPMQVLGGVEKSIRLSYDRLSSTERKVFLCLGILVAGASARSLSAILNGECEHTARRLVKLSLADYDEERSRYRLAHPLLNRFVV